MQTHARIFSVVAIAMHVSTLQKGCAAFSTLPIRKSMSTLPPEHAGTFSSAQDYERELNGALQFARDMDKRYGLCTEPSQTAWRAVDDIYQKIQALRGGGEQKDSIAQPQSPRLNTRRRKVVLSGRNMSSEIDIKGRRYFF